MHALGTCLSSSHQIPGCSVAVQALQVLSFSRHVQLRSSTDPDPAVSYQAKLALHAARTLALPVGRGALTLSTVNLLPTEPLTAHEIVLHGARRRVRTRNVGSVSCGAAT